VVCDPGFQLNDSGSDCELTPASKGIISVIVIVGVFVGVAGVPIAVDFVRGKVPAKDLKAEAKHVDMRLGPFVLFIGIVVALITASFAIHQVNSMTAALDDIQDFSPVTPTDATLVAHAKQSDIPQIPSFLIASLVFSCLGLLIAGFCLKSDVWKARVSKRPHRLEDDRKAAKMWMRISVVLAFLSGGLLGGVVTSASTKEKERLAELPSSDLSSEMKDLRDKIVNVYPSMLNAAYAGLGLSLGLATIGNGIQAWQLATFRAQTE
jgi:hypothetical protein